MKFSTSKLMLLAGTAAALPTQVEKRALTDTDILNFALTLEHLENAFYQEALAKYPQSAFDAKNAVARLRFNIGEISKDEMTHVSFLESALGDKAVKPCNYDFGLTDVESFLRLSSILEGVGVSAYLGAAASITEKAYLTAAGSILTVEARHNAYIRDNQMAPGPQSPFPSPFDIPLDPMAVYTLASGFITSCPSGSALPFTAFPALTLDASNPGYQRAGMTLALTSAKALPATVYCAFPAVAGPFYAKATVSGKSVKCTLPSGISGESFAMLTSNGSGAITDANTLAGPAILQVQAPYTYPGFPM